jgi:hypothetical protein
MSTTIVHLDRCIEVAGNDRVGRFLYRLWKWQGRTRHVRDGRRWVSWSYAEWAKGLNLTYTQFKYMIEKATAGEFVLREQHKWKGKNVLFVAFTDKCLLSLTLPSARLKDGQKCPTLGDGQKCPTLYKNPIKEPGERTKSADGFAAANPETICLSGKKSYSKEIGNEIAIPDAQGGANMTTAAEIGAKFAAAKPKSIDTLKPDKVAGLIAVWQSSGQIVPGFTKKEYGQLKYLIGKWPEGQSPEILAFVLSHWYEVTDAVETHTTKFKSPASPDLGYLVKYQNIALNLWLKSKMGPKTKQAPKPAKEVVQTIAQPAPVKEKIATMADLLAMEAAEKVAS